MCSAVYDALRVVWVDAGPERAYAWLCRVCRPYDDKFLSPRPPLIYNPDVYTESANKMYQLRWRQLGRKLNLPPCGATTTQKRDALRATAATDAQYAKGESVDEREGGDYGLRGLDDEDVFFDEEVCDNIWGDPIVATRRQPCATPSLAKRDEQALVSQRPVSPKSLLELSLDASSAAPRHEQLAATRIRESIAATRIQAYFRGKLARDEAFCDPVWVVVWPEGSTRYEGKRLIVPDDALVKQFKYYSTRLHHVFESLIKHLGIGPHAHGSLVLRSVAGRVLLDLDQTLYEANRWRCIEGVRGRGGLYLELCPIGLVSKKAKQAVDAICEHACRESIAATRIQACWRGVLGRDNYQAAKQAKAKKEQRAKRAAAKREATAVQLASDETLQSATTLTSPSEPLAEQPTADSVDELAATPSQFAMVVEESRELAAELAVAASSEEEVADIGAALEVDLGTTPGDLERLAMAESADEAALRTGVERSLAPVVESSGVAAPKPTLALAANTPLWEAIGWRLVNKEPRVGGMCMIVALLESPIAKEDFLHRLLDHLEHDADAANTVASYHEFAEEEIKTYELKSLRHAVRRVLGVSDVATCVAQLREPIGYRLGARLIAPLPVAVLFAAASYMKLDIVVLDASTATPLYAIVRCPSSPPVLLHTCRC